MTKTMTPLEPPKELEAITEKVINGIRLSREEGLELFNTPHADWVYHLADLRRRQSVGDIVYYSSTLFIHPTNLCELSCPMCSFYAKPGWKSAWFDTPEKIEEKIRKALHHDITEIHIVGGLWRECNLDYYQDLFTRIKNLNPDFHIKALTPVEYDFLSKQHGISIEQVFEKMMGWGLGSLPGGGAEILIEEIRKKIAPGKITSDEYLDIHERAHKLGLRSNITMLFGHIEENHHIVDHLLKIRDLQERTSGFQTFVPLKYHVENNALGKRSRMLKPKEIKRVYAISRLLLDNVRNIKILWNYLGVEEAQDILNCGGNDLGSTALEEKIITMAGGIKVNMTQDTMESVITSIGRVPKKIHSGHQYATNAAKA